MALPPDLESVAARCRNAGLDLYSTTSVGSYNARVSDDFHLPGQPHSLVMVVANTRALWPHIDRFVRDSPVRVPDPVDSYVVQVVQQALTDVDDVVDVRFDHEPPPRRVALQQLADVAGLAWLSPSHLCIHPEFGPWIALRAAIVFGRASSADGSPAQPQCDCSQHCLPKLQDALSLSQTDSAETDAAQIKQDWTHWVAMRDSCPVGRQHRYDDEQIVYHYTGQRPSRWP